MRGQPGFWDLDERYERPSAVGDPLEKLNTIIPWAVFEKPLAKALKRSDGSKGGRPQFPAVLMFEILVLQALYNLSDDQAEFVIQDRLSFMRFLWLGLSDKVAGAKTIWLFRESLGSGPVPSPTYSPPTSICHGRATWPKVVRSLMQRSDAQAAQQPGRLVRSRTSGRTSPPSTRRRIAMRDGQ